MSHDESSKADDEPVDRREFLKKSALGAAAAAGAGGAAEAKDSSADGNRPLGKDAFLPEEVWKDRMTPPDDGKKYGWVVDTRRCFGCHGCEVACKAENDVPLGDFIRQTIYHDFDRDSGQVARIMVPMACQHCEDAPCIKACPCGAMHKGPGGTVQVDYNSCSGHASCADACPYGAIYIDPVANQAVKCHNCTHRIDVGMDPACVTTCPSEALYFGDLNDPESKVSKIKDRIESESDATLDTLRPEKETKPRMEFIADKNHPVKEWEPKIPTEGQSYKSDAYSVYEWGEKPADGSDANGEDK